MRPRSLAVLLVSAASALQAGEPARLVSAQLLRGPGVAPREGAPPFKPTLSGEIRLEKPLKGKAIVVLHPMREADLEGWRKRGAKRVFVAELVASEPGVLRFSYAAHAQEVRDVTHLGVEVRIGRKRLARLDAPLEERFLQSAPPRDHRQEER